MSSPQPAGQSHCFVLAVWSDVRFSWSAVEYSWERERFDAFVQRANDVGEMVSFRVFEAPARVYRDDVFAVKWLSLLPTLRRLWDLEFDPPEVSGLH